MLPLAVALLALGAALLVVGFRGRRINDHPICRRCRFDLIGLFPGGAPGTAAPRCPECGADLSGRRAIRAGARRRGRLALSVGLTLALLGASLAGTLAWTRAAHFNWNTVKPAWLLLYEAGAKPPDTGVILELAARFKAGSVTAPQSRQLIERALAIQADPSIPWLLRLGEVVETGRVRGIVSDEQWTAFARQSAPSMSMQPVQWATLIRRQGRLFFVPMLGVNEARGGLSTTLRKRHHLDRFALGGQEIPIPPDWTGRQPDTGFQLGIRGGFSFGMMPIPDFQGHAGVEMDWTISIEDDSAPVGSQVLATFSAHVSQELDSSTIRQESGDVPQSGWPRGAPDPSGVRPLQTGPGGAGPAVVPPRR